MKKLLITILFLLACGGGGSDSVAAPSGNQPLYVRLVLIECLTTARCAREEDALSQFARYKAYYKSQLDIEVILSGFDKVVEPTEMFMTIQEFEGSQWRFYSIKRHLDKLGIIANTKGRESLLIIDKYLINKSDNYVYPAGLSHTCGLYNAGAWSIVYAASGGESTDALKLVLGTHLAHEYGHYCGADHSNNSNPNNYDFMSQDLWADDELIRPPSLMTLESINKCLTRRSYVKTKECNKNRRPKLCLKNAGLRDLEKPTGEIFGMFE